MIPGRVNTITSKLAQQVFLAGSSGAIGQRLIPSLQKEFSVSALVRDKSKLSFSKTPLLQVIEADLKTDSKLSLPGKETLSPSAIYLSLVSEDNDADSEMRGIRNVVELLRSQHVPNSKSLFILTSGPYSAGLQNDPFKSVDEFSRNLKKSAWDRTSFEDFAMSFADDNLSVAIVRPGWVYGLPSEVDRWISHSQAQKKLAYSGDLNSFIPLVHADDLIDLYLRLMELKPCGIFHAVEESLTFLQILAVVQTHLKVPLEHQSLQSMLANDIKFAHAMQSDFSCRVRATNSLQFGWKPRRDFAKTYPETHAKPEAPPEQQKIN